MARDLGIDLGTANTLVYMKGKGIIVNEPSVVAVNTETKEILAVGNEAKEMIGRTPGNIIAIRPMKDGVIADFEVTQAMLRYFIGKAYKRSFFEPKPRVVVCVPSGATEVEKRAILEAAVAAGATEVEKRAILEAAVAAGAKEKDAYLIEEPMAASIGAGLPIGEPTGSMVVDIGGGTSEVAVISLGGVVTSTSLRVAGDELDNCIINYIKKEYNLTIGDRTAEEIKLKVGCAYPKEVDEYIDIRGRNLLTGLPKTVTVSSAQILIALKESVTEIVETIKRTLEATPPELSADIMEFGITLTGGGAMLSGLDTIITEETGIPVHIGEEPLNCVVLGTGLVLEQLDALKTVLISPKKFRI